METRKKRTKIAVSVLALAGLLVFSLAVAGDLEPSGPQEPIGNTLNEVGPRIALSQDSTPGNANHLYIIANPGSYYLTGDETTTETGIRVDANNVTIDLMGYSLTGPGLVSSIGIYMYGRSNVEVRNGTIRNFGWRGILENSPAGRGHRIIGIRVLSNAETGILLFGSGHVVNNCTAARNGGSGIYAENGCTIVHNVVYENEGTGIWAGNGSTVTANTAYRNQHGIHVVNGCTVLNNTAYENQQTGIDAMHGSAIMANVVRDNNQTAYWYLGGITVQSNCLIKGNAVTNNKEANIYVNGSNNAVEDNLVTNSTNGILFTAYGNFYANNRASDNTTNYANAAGQTDGGGNYSF